MAARRPLIAGNWKMFGRRGDLAELPLLAQEIGGAGERVDVLVCPPSAYVASAAELVRGGPVTVGGQDCSAAAQDSARTGDVSAAMLADVGARYCIVGHSERRSLFGDSNALVRTKGANALAAGLIPIVCVGETLAEREAGKVAEVLAAQVRESVPTGAGEVVVAYEPVWAIGGDRTPTPAEITEAHRSVRDTLAQVRPGEANSIRILYGGSVNPKNAGEIFAAEGVDGALVGRASLKAADFAAIIRAHPSAG